MNSQTVGLRVSAVLFGLLCLAQLLRLLIQPEVMVAGHLLPLWPSVIAVIVLAGMCFWMWRLSTGQHA
jgi:hypothetical protein